MFTTDYEKTLALELLKEGLANQSDDIANDIILEYYAGKSKELLRCESYLQHIIDDLKANRYNLTKQSSAIKNNEYNKKLEKEIKNFFKVKGVNIYWGAGRVNAFTIKPCVLFSPQYKNSIVDGKPSSLVIDICIYEELITQGNLTAQELLAIILHEIGHNFYFCPVTFGLSIFNCVAGLGLPIIANFISRITLKAILGVSDVIKTYLPIVANSIAAIKDCISEIKMLFGPIRLAATLGRVLSGRARFISTGIIDGVVGYGDEQGADTFAARYGYGPELASALRKMSNLEETMYGKVVAGTGIAGSLYHDFFELSLDIIAMMIMDPHPNSSQRASTMLRKLKRDLVSGNYPPEMKKNLEGEIKRMEEAYENVTRNNSSSDVQIRQKWYKVIDTVTHGHSDFREIFSFYFDSFQF